MKRSKLVFREKQFRIVIRRKRLHALNFDFLGYNPLPKADTVAEKLVRQRTSLGLSQKESAERLGVDPSTLAQWEQGKRVPQGAFMGRVQRFLQNPDPAGERRAG